MTRNARNILEAGGPEAYVRALAALREDTRIYWQECLSDGPDEGRKVKVNGASGRGLGPGRAVVYHRADGMPGEHPQPQVATYADGFRQSEMAVFRRATLLELGFTRRLGYALVRRKSPSLHKFHLPGCRLRYLRFATLYLSRKILNDQNTHHCP